MTERKFVKVRRYIYRHIDKGYEGTYVDLMAMGWTKNEIYNSTIFYKTNKFEEHEVEVHGPTEFRYHVVDPMGDIIFTGTQKSIAKKFNWTLKTVYNYSSIEHRLSMPNSLYIVRVDRHGD